MADILHMPSRPRAGAIVDDTEARARALDVDRSWIVEAPAGSGKTGLLIQRYLRLLAHESVAEPESVLAITFTKAATEEIRERVLRELRHAAEGIPPEGEYERATRVMAEAVLVRDTARGWRLREEPRRLRIRTIDAVCAEIARSLPVLSGGGGTMQPLEDAAPLYREAARRTWLRLGGDDSALSAALEQVLLYRDADLTACEALVAGMLAEREQWGALVPLDGDEITAETLETRTRARLDATLEAVICSALSRLVRALPETTLARLTSLASALGERPGYKGRLSPLAICRELHTAPGVAAEHLEHWQALTYLLITPSGGNWRSGFGSNHLFLEISPAERAVLKELLLEFQDRPDLLDALRAVNALPPVRYPDEQWDVAKALFRVLRQALLDLEEVFAENEACDFAEPALLARRALDQPAGPESLRAALGSDFRHLLVDEMQDTSTRQYELIERLTAGWDGTHRTVFLVGDPKQSIYLFRQARVERFVETMRTERLGTLPVGLLRLTANFRSQAGLVTAFNQDFGNIFPRTTERPEDVEYFPAAARLPESASLAGVAGAAWHLTVPDEDRATAPADRRTKLLRYARQARETIERWRARPLPEGRSTPWKIAVLVRSRASLGHLLPELRRMPSVPFRAVNIDPLDKRREVLDLLALTRALLHPADRTAWLAVLRAPWCGLTLLDLHTLTGADDESFSTSTVTQLLDRRGHELSLDGIAHLERVWPVLQAAVRAAGRTRLPALVERTWRALGGDAPLDETALENARAFLRLLREIDSASGEVSLPELTRRMQRLYAGAAEEPGAVDLATIHGAKGLEWDVVLVPELERRAPRARARLLEWEELPSRGILLAPIAGKGEESAALNRWLSRLRRERERAERQRLFYVACTRAREELHLFGVLSRRAKGELAAESGSLLEAAWPAAEHRLDARATTSIVIPAPELVPSFALAAAADSASGNDVEHWPVLERLPLSLPIAASVDADWAERPGAPDLSPVPFLRPKGSFVARCLGTAMHAFLEETARRLARGTEANTVKSELSAWRPRVRAVLRNAGLPPAQIEAQMQTVLTGLERTLGSDVGRWLLEARTGAHDELALVQGEEHGRQYRLDRVFYGGPTPLAPGEGYLWIIDYKTAARGDDIDPDGLAEFIAGEKARYQAQLESYARAVGEANTRLGLWFPLLGQLTWWVAEEAAPLFEQGELFALTSPAR